VLRTKIRLRINTYIRDFAWSLFTVVNPSKRNNLVRNQFSEKQQISLIFRPHAILSYGDVGICCISILMVSIVPIYENLMMVDIVGLLQTTGFCFCLGCERDIHTSHCPKQCKVGKTTSVQSITILKLALWEFAVKPLCR
jgi:hypothetical protein